MTRRYDSKISAIFWGIILIFPIIWFVLSFVAYCQPFSDNAVSVTLQDLEVFLDNFVSFNPPLFVFAPAVSEFIFSLWLPNFQPGSLGVVVVGFLMYYIFIHLVRLAVDVVLFIPHLFHSWISKFDRKVE